MKRSTNQRWYLAILLAAMSLLGTIAIPVSISYGLSRSQSNPEILLTLLAIAGVVGLLASLTIISVAFAAVGLADGSQALGLPEGTVRAVIALSLIVIFVITAVFLYGNLAEPQVTRLEGLTQAQLDSLPTAQIVSVRTEAVNGETRYTVERVLEQSRASEDFAKQVLTTVSTLVVSIAGFYFGTRAVASARAATAISDPALDSVLPASGVQGSEVALEIAGSDLQLASVVRLVHGARELAASEVMSNANQIHCKIKIGANDPTGKWDLVVTCSDGGEDRLPGAFSVTAPQPAPQP